MSATRYKRPHVDIIIVIEMARERNRVIKKKKHPVLYNFNGLKNVLFSRSPSVVWIHRITNTDVLCDEYFVVLVEFVALMKIKRQRGRAFACRVNRVTSEPYRLLTCVKSIDLNVGLLNNSQRSGTIGDLKMSYNL